MSQVCQVTFTVTILSCYSHQFSLFLRLSLPFFFLQNNPGPTWDASLPPMWSLFIPPNASSVGVYGDVIPDRPPGNSGNDNAAGNTSLNAEANAGEAGAFSSSSGGVRNMPPARAERSQARARGRGRARARGFGTPSARMGRAVPEQERPLVANSPSVGSGEEIEMATRRRPGWRDMGDDG